jgi:hypothetical protein
MGPEPRVLTVSWEEMTVPALCAGTVVTSQVRFRVGDRCEVQVRLPDGYTAQGEGPDLFDALIAARRGLEAHGFLLGCNGGRRDVYPSAMLQQTSQGRRAYVLSSPPGGSRLPAVDIFAPAPDLSLVATVDEQRASFERWIDGLPDEAPRK